MSVRLRAGGVLALVLACAAGGAAAHEYWLDPIDPSPDADGGLLLANIRNGQDFAGTSFPFDPARFTRVELVGPGGARPVTGRLGDFPALRAKLDAPGTWMLTLETGPKPLVYDSMAKFREFLDYHGLGALADAHAARALPEHGIRERYFRYAKTLVRTVGADPAEDETRSAVFAPRGQRLELVPLVDPYVAREFVATLLLEGEPLAGAQVELFERTPENVVTRRVTRTDADGRARFDTARPGDYLVNAVQVLEPPEARALTGGAEADASAPHWESLWASLTFERR